MNLRAGSNLSGEVSTGLPSLVGILVGVHNLCRRGTDIAPAMIFRKARVTRRWQHDLPEVFRMNFEQLLVQPFSEGKEGG